MNDIFEEPKNRLEFQIICAGLWEMGVDFKPTYYKKHSAADAWRYRNTPSATEEVWIPEFMKIELWEDEEAGIE